MYWGRKNQTGYTKNLLLTGGQLKFSRLIRYLDELLTVVNSRTAKIYYIIWLLLMPIGRFCICAAMSRNMTICTCAQKMCIVCQKKNCKCSITKHDEWYYCKKWIVENFIDKFVCDLVVKPITFNTVLFGLLFQFCLFSK